MNQARSPCSIQTRMKMMTKSDFAVVLTVIGVLEWKESESDEETD